MWFNIGILVICIGLSRAIGLSTPLEDPGALDKYSISYVTPEYWQIAVRKNATALAEGYMLDIGDGLSCYIRQRGFNDTSTVKRHGDKLEFDRLLEDTLQRGVDIIINGGKKCSSFMSGFWTYEYCPNSHLSQFHGNLQTTRLYYILGRPKKSDQHREFQLRYNNFNHYISEILGSGDVCDVTGNPRVVEVQYVCGPDANPATIQWIKEVKTCYYEVQISVPKLCELELLSSNEDKKTSNPVICVDQKKLSKGVLDLLGKYDPKFVGSDFYLLEPNFGSTGDQRKVLLYSGKHKIEDGFEKNDPELYENIGSAFSRMLYQQLLMPSDGPTYKPGDEISWISDVVDLHGNYLSRLQFNLSSSNLADISLDNTIQFPGSGNLLYHRQGPLEDKAREKIQSNSQVPSIDSQTGKLKNFRHDSQEKNIKNTESDENFRIAVLGGTNEPTQILDISDVEDLFDHLLTPEQLETALLLKDAHSLEDLLEHAHMIREGNEEVQHAFKAPHDGPKQTGTTGIHPEEPANKKSQDDENDRKESGAEVHKKEKDIKLSQEHDSRLKGSDDIKAQKFAGSHDIQENSETQSSSELNSDLYDKSKKKGEALEDKTHDSERHLHDEL